MGTIDDIKNMKNEGRTDLEISSVLKSRGLSNSEISSALSQAQIKEAIYDSSAEVQPPIENQDALQPSMFPTEEETQIQAPTQYSPPVQDYTSQEQMYAQQPQYQYQQYQPYQAQSYSSDTITEISEQVVSEKLSKLKNQLEKTIDLKNNLETSISNIEERLKRIEKIIDTLQISILKKIGETIDNVDNIKTEMIETQKTFKASLKDHKHKH